ncbi:MAG TPA: sulfatase-like hydrolase/transferase [Thermoanaerobaculia bacterium]|nr:sulfatase-like hydrolase/transferase [Thermoanaerobaculia bacterium]
MRRIWLLALPLLFLAASSAPPRPHIVLISVDTLALALRRAGYDTAGVVAVSHIGRSTRFGRGFNAFSDPVIRSTQHDNRRDADEINSDARRLVDAHVASRGKQPLFLFVHYFDCHYPYRWWDRTEKTEDPWNPQLQRRRDVQLRRYDDGVSRVDAHIRQLYDDVKAKLGTNVVFCVVADHGEQIGDQECRSVTTTSTARRSPCRSSSPGRRFRRRG